MAKVYLLKRNLKKNLRNLKILKDYYQPRYQILEREKNVLKVAKKLKINFDFNLKTIFSFQN